ncbi:4Fe-4S binding protein [Parvibacter caecicola]|uniref:Ferredoxin-type protein NapH n=1 Tax=Parvibacter caecicola TaxID=747645 RepID=A0A7W5GQ94_9ACTN|nr:4Fe-4S binding protein [Parvibacter caecicola]MBB3172095.1 ferredoxin-type protein NapH [Parvibacter caecicola]MCR2041029.1 4Fe-4S binding protein [Parvibacter caecicola]
MAAETKKATADLSAKMRTQKLRTAIAPAVFAVMAAGLILGVSTGTMSGFGWESISALCPLGAVATMLATKTMVPRAIISLVIMAALILLVGRAFCAWLCPSMLITRLQEFLRTPQKRRKLAAETHEKMVDIARFEIAQAGEGAAAGAAGAKAAVAADAASVATPLSESEKAGLSGCSSAGCGSGCASCVSAKMPHKKLDSRHYVLGGALLSTAIFGFPVFCLVCPVGLTFATVLVVWRLFAAGDMTIAVILVPALLILELVFLRKWCTRFCPLSALMNLVSRFSKTLVPVIDDSKCLETSQGVPCSRCAQVCESDINIRHIAYGERTLADCSRCRNCADVCPTKAITFPVFSGVKAKAGAAAGIGANAPAPVAQPAAVMLDEDALLEG